MKVIELFRLFVSGHCLLIRPTPSGKVIQMVDFVVFVFVLGAPVVVR